MTVVCLRLMRNVACLAASVLAVSVAGLPAGQSARAEVATPSTSASETKTPPAPTPATPSKSPPAPATSAAPSAPTPAPAPAPGPAPGTGPAAAPPSDDMPAAEAPVGKPGPTEIEPNGSPGIPDNATTESVTVPKRSMVLVTGTSSYDDAFKSIKASTEKVMAAMAKAGIKPSGHPITIFSEPDDKGFKYKVGIPIASKPDKVDLENGVTFGESPGGKAIKFQHRGAYDDIDSTYDVITAYLDAKGLQVDNPYIEEYLTDLTTRDDPNLQVDIYVFVK